MCVCVCSVCYKWFINDLFAECWDSGSERYLFVRVANSGEQVKAGKGRSSSRAVNSGKQVKVGQGRSSSRAVNSGQQVKAGHRPVQ